MGEIENSNNSSALVLTPQKDVSFLNSSHIAAGKPFTNNTNLVTRENIQAMSNPISLQKGNIAEETLQTTKKTIDSLANISFSGLSSLKAGADKLITQSNSMKKIFTLFAGAGFFFNGLVNVLKTFTDTALGANRQQFKPTKLILALMSAAFGVKAIEYAKGKNNLFDSFPNVLKFGLPLVFTKVLDDSMNNSNSASYKIGKLTGVGEPISGLLNSFTTFINPARIFGETKYRTPPNVNPSTT